MDKVRLFVGSIPEGTTEQALIEEFGKYGSTSDVLLRSDATEPGRMWAFVSYPDQGTAAAAIAALSGQFSFPGASQPITVSFARSAAENTSSAAAPSGGGGGGGGGGGPPPAEATEAVAAATVPGGGVTAAFGGQVALAAAAAAAALAASAAEPSLAIFGGSTTPAGVPQQAVGDHALYSLVAATASTGPGLTATVASPGPTKLFVGSIPGGTTQEVLRAEFERFGRVTDVFLKDDFAEPQRSWAFVNFLESSAASAAVAALNERLMLPGGTRPSAVGYARSSQAQRSMAATNLVQGGGLAGHCATKLFVGSIPSGTPEALLRSEFEKFGVVTEIALRVDRADPTRMWGFLSYAEPQSAAIAVGALHEKLLLPGSVRPCPVKFARISNQRGGAPAGGAGAAATAAAGLAGALAFGGQAAAAVGSGALAGGAACGASGGAGAGGAAPGGGALALGDWTAYYTATGLPYYHNARTGATQWEAPPEVASALTGGTAAIAAPATVAVVGGSLQGLTAAQLSTDLLGLYGGVAGGAAALAAAPVAAAAVPTALDAALAATAQPSLYGAASILGLTPGLHYSPY